MSWLTATLVGAASGVLASMGLGGGFILVVYLAVFTDVAQHSAQGINLLFFLPVIAVSVAIHIKNKMIDIRTALVCGGIGSLSAVLGYLVAQSVDGLWLRRAFAVFIIIAGLKDLLAKKKLTK